MISPSARTCIVSLLKMDQDARSYQAQVLQKCMHIQRLIRVRGEPSWSPEQHRVLAAGLEECLALWRDADEGAMPTERAMERIQAVTAVAEGLGLQDDMALGVAKSRVLAEAATLEVRLFGISRELRRCLLDRLGPEAADYISGHGAKGDI